MTAKLWLTDGDAEGRSYVVRIERDGSVVGWLSGPIGVVIDLMAERAYALANGEDEDSVFAYVLDDAGVLPCEVSTKAHRQIGFTEVILTWRDPLVRGRAAYKSESGYTKIIDI